MARIQSTGPYRNIAIALTSLGIVTLPILSSLFMPSQAVSTAPEATPSLRSRFQAEFEAFVSELQRSDASMQEAQKRRP